MKTQNPQFFRKNSYNRTTWLPKALCVMIAALPVFSYAGQMEEKAQEIVMEQTKAQSPLTPSTDYLNRANAAPHVLQVLMDQHSKRGKKVKAGGIDYVYIGALQSALTSLEEARTSFLAASEKDSALSNKQRSIVTSLKTTAKPALSQKGRKTLSEMELIDAITREIRDVAPLVREFHAEERLQNMTVLSDR